MASGPRYCWLRLGTSIQGATKKDVSRSGGSNFRFSHAAAKHVRATSLRATVLPWQFVIAMNQRVVSLGGNCMATMEMRKFFGTEEANLFDWWITPAHALVRLIRRRFRRIVCAGESADRE